jgi:hypothetical protein
MNRKPSRYLIIVSRERPELCQHLRQVVGDQGIDIVIDRRAGNTSTLDSSGPDRRRPPGPENDITGRQYLIVSRKRERGDIGLL